MFSRLGLLTALFHLLAASCFIINTDVLHQRHHHHRHSVLLSASNDEPSPPSLQSRKEMLHSLIVATTTTTALTLLSTTAAWAAAAAAAVDTTTRTSIMPCPADDSKCISTASVRRMDQYMPPWTYPETMSTAEVMARLKGAIQNVAPNAEIVLVRDNNNNNDSTNTQPILCVTITRNFATDELLFVVNPVDHVVTFRSRQIDGPDVSDFGAQRKRLEEIKKKVGGGVFQSSSDEFAKEGPLGQLKAFYGIQSGAGFEDVLLDED